MKRFSKVISLLLALSVFFSVAVMNGCSGGETDETSEPSVSSFDAVAAKDLKIGVLLPDSANAASVYYYQLTGLTSSAKAAGLDEVNQLVIKKSVSDVTFDAKKDFSSKIEVPSTEENTTDADGKETSTKNSVEIETALEAAASLVSGGCNVIVAASDVYSEFTAYLASQLPDIIFLQYGKGNSKLPNIKYYSDKMYEAFYLAGIAAATLSKDKTAGFVCGENNAYVKDYVNAFANGMTSVDAKSSVKLSSTGVRLDLVLERTLTEALIDKYKCGVIAQSVVTALPQVAAESGKKYCFGFGYDMSSDAKKYNVFSVIWKWDVFFGEVLGDITDGKFTSVSYSAGLAEGLVNISKIRVDNADLSKAISDAKAKIISEEIKPLAGVPTDGGFVKSVKIV